MNRSHKGRTAGAMVEGLEGRRFLAGDFSFAFPVGGAGGDCTVNAVATDRQGFSYVTGSFRGTVDFNPSSKKTLNLTAGADGDAFVAKYGGKGQLIWARQIVNANGPDAGNAVAVDGSGNVFVGGQFQGSADFKPGKGAARRTSDGFVAGGASNATDGFVWKLNANGNYVAVNTIGGSGADAVKGITVGRLDDVFAVGSFSGTATFGEGLGPPLGALRQSFGGADGFMARYVGANLSFVLARQFGGAGNDELVGVSLDPQGNVVTAGSFVGQANLDFRAHHEDNDDELPIDDDGTVRPFHLVPTVTLTSRGGSDAVVLKTDGGGLFIYAKQMGGTANDRAASVRVDSSSNVIAGGTFSGVASMDPVDTNNGKVTSNGGTDAFVTKLNAAGNLAWARTAGGGGNDAVASLLTNKRGDVFAGGSFVGTVDFAPGKGTVNLAGRANAGNGFVWKLSAAGNFGYARMFQAQEDGATFSTSGIALDPSGNVYVAGTFEGAYDFDPGAGVRVRDSGADSDGVLVKLLA